jgi:hypothetical protein
MWHWWKVEILGTFETVMGGAPAGMRSSCSKNCVGGLVMMGKAVTRWSSSITYNPLTMQQHPYNEFTVNH